jgi:uncharacterized protein DUF4436
MESAMKNNQRLQLFIVFLVIVICVLAVTFVNRTFVREEAAQKMEVAKEQAERFGEGYLEVNAEVIRVDPIAGRMILELNFIPHGRLDAGGGVLTSSLEVDISDVNGDPITFMAGRLMSAHEATVDLHEGEAEDYPFDRHKALVEILVLEKSGETWNTAPAQLDFTGNYHGLAFHHTVLPADANGYIGFDVRLERSPLVRGTAIFCMAVMWGLAIVNLFQLWAVLTGRIHVDFGLFGYMSGFLVAMYFFRQILPDIPPFIGVYADYLAFFWVELITAGISIILAFVWLQKLMKVNSTESDHKS